MLIDVATLLSRAMAISFFFCFQNFAFYMRGRLGGGEEGRGCFVLGPSTKEKEVFLSPPTKVGRSLISGRR